MRDKLLDDFPRLIETIVPDPRVLKDITFSSDIRADLGLDSLGLLNLVFNIEAEYGIDLMLFLEAVANTNTVGDIIDVVIAARGECSVESK